MPAVGLDTLVAAARRTIAVIVAVEQADRDGGDLRAALTQVLADHGEQVDGSFDRPEAEAMAGAARELAAVLDTDDADRAADVLNLLMARWCEAPRLVRHAGWPLHLHVDGGADSWHVWFAAAGAFSLAAALAGHDRPPWGRCEAVDCGRPYLDDGRGAPRRFCSTRCGTRARVRSHRAAARGDGPAR